MNGETNWNDVENYFSIDDNFKDHGTDENKRNKKEIQEKYI